MVTKVPHPMAPQKMDSDTVKELRTELCKVNIAYPRIPLKDADLDRQQDFQLQKEIGLFRNIHDSTVFEKDALLQIP